MKKLLSILLATVCALSIFMVPGLAAEPLPVFSAEVKEAAQRDIVSQEFLDGLQTNTELSAIRKARPCTRRTGPFYYSKYPKRAGQKAAKPEISPILSPPLIFGGTPMRNVYISWMTDRRGSYGITWMPQQWSSFCFPRCERHSRNEMHQI